MNHNSRGRKILELLKSSKKDSTTEPNHTNSKDVENEEDNGDQSRGRKILELLKSSKKDSTTEPNHTNSKDVENEEDNRDDMSFNEDDDDSDRGKNYEPPSSETDSSDDVPVFNEIQNEVSRNKTSAKTNSNGHELRLLEEDLNLSSDNENIAENQVGLDLQGTVGVRRKMKNKSISTQIGKKRVVHTSEWACNIQKRKYSAGEEYISKKGKVVAARIIKPPCSCRLKCSEKLLQSDRQETFNAYWSQEKGNDTKRQFIVSCVEKHSTVRSRKRDLASNKSKQNTLQYYFTVKGIRTRVCKLMFLNTLSISNTVVVNVLKNIEPGGIVKIDQRGKQTPVNKTHNDTVESVVRHISSFPNYSSHYTREKSDMKYLGPHLNIEKMYELYVEDCNENDFNPLLIAKKWLYYDVFNKKFKLNFNTNITTKV